jgi:hypothetical protein
MIVRKHHGVERRQIAESEQRREPSLWADNGTRPGTLAPNWIHEEAMAVDLQQNRRVAKPGDAQP